MGVARVNKWEAGQGGECARSSGTLGIILGRAGFSPEWLRIRQSTQLNPEICWRNSPSKSLWKFSADSAKWDFI